MNDEDKLIAEQIVSARKDAGLSQEALSEKLYVTRQAVSNWERGRTRPSQEMIEKIAGALGVGVERLVGASSEDHNDALEMEWNAAVQVDGEQCPDKEMMMMEQKKTKKTFSRQSILIGLGYAIGLFLGTMVFFVVGLLMMQPMVWAAMLFAGIGIFFIVGLSLHFMILWKQPDAASDQETMWSK